MPRRDLDQWLWQVGEELQRLSEEMSPSAKLIARNSCWEPRVDLIEGEGMIALKVELAGVSAADMRLSFNYEKNSIHLRGKRMDDSAMIEAKRVHILEVFYGEFEREIVIPGEKLDPESIQASYENGILRIVAHRMEMNPIDPEPPAAMRRVRRTVLIRRI